MRRRSEVRDEKESTVASIDIRSLASLGAIKRCPVCRGTDVRWFGVLRVCAAGTHVFHWRDAVRESVEPVADQGGTPEPKPCVRPDEDLDLLRGQLEAPAHQVRDRFNRVDRKPHPEVLIREQVMNYVTDELT